MEHKTWTTTDKTSWGPGPWQDEPDKEQFADEATGLPCLVKRSPLGGNLCGYVGVSEGHPWLGKDYDDIDAEVHGGLTYAGFCQEGDEARTICHIPGPGEPGRLYWLGFDCGHAWDVSPGMDARYPDFFRDPTVTYKTVAYVKAECARLAAQAAEAAALPVVLQPSRIAFPLAAGRPVRKPSAIRHRRTDCRRRWLCPLR